MNQRTVEVDGKTYFVTFNSDGQVTDIRAKRNNSMFVTPSCVWREGQPKTPTALRVILAAQA